MRVERRDAAIAVIEQALYKALSQLALAQSAASLCGGNLADELDYLVRRAKKLRKNIVKAEPLSSPANAGTQG